MLKLKLVIYRSGDAELINLATEGVGGTIKTVHSNPLALTKHGRPAKAVRYEAYKPGSRLPRRSDGKGVRGKAQFRTRRDAVTALMRSYGLEPSDWKLV